MKRFLLAAATAGLLVTAAPATPASAMPCHDSEPCITICWHCLEGPHVGCWRVEDVGQICV